MQNPRARRGALALAALIILGFAAFKAKRRWDGESFAKTLRGPTRHLCQAYDPRESGGCLADCMSRRSLAQGDAALRAARELAALGTHPNAGVEEHLARVRAASAAVTTALSDVCSPKLPREAPFSPEAQRCISAVRATQTIGDLVRADEDFAAYAASWSGADIPSWSACRNE